MGLLAPIRKLAPKALPRAQATTVLALKGLSGRDDIEIMRQVLELVEWGTRAKLIISLTGAGNEASINRMVQKEHGGSPQGRPNGNLGMYMKSPVTHLEASFFLNKFICYTHYESGPLNAESFIRAFRHYRGVMLRLRPGFPKITPEDAHLIAQKYLAGQCGMGHCMCGVHFMQTREPVRVGKAMRCGVCPNCAIQRENAPRRSRSTSPAGSAK
jgi:hypothetical protein